MDGRANGNGRRKPQGDRLALLAGMLAELQQFAKEENDEFLDYLIEMALLYCKEEIIGRRPLS